MPRKIELPNVPEHRDYVIYLYKNRNNFHNMNNKDIDNLLKLLNYGKLDIEDFPVKNVKKNKQCNKLNGYCFTKFDNKYSQV